MIRCEGEDESSHVVYSHSDHDRHHRNEADCQAKRSDIFLTLIWIDIVHGI
jgi:hypothetical protein